MKAMNFLRNIFCNEMLGADKLYKIKVKLAGHCRQFVVDLFIDVLSCVYFRAYVWTVNNIYIPCKVNWLVVSKAGSLVKTTGLIQSF